MKMRVLSTRHNGIFKGDIGSVEEVMYSQGEIAGYGVQFPEVKHYAAHPLVETKPAIIYMLPHEVEIFQTPEEIEMFRKCIRLNGKDKDG